MPPDFYFGNYGNFLIGESLIPNIFRGASYTHPQITIKRGIMSGQGSAGNVIAALASFFIPGLGQLLQGRVLKAALQFVLAGLLWLIWMGWVIHLWSIVDAATFKN